MFKLKTVTLNCYDSLNRLNNLTAPQLCLLQFVCTSIMLKKLSLFVKYFLIKLLNIVYLCTK